MKTQEAIEKLREFCKLRAFCELYPDACQKDKCEIYMAIEALSIDIVRCKDCKWFGLVGCAVLIIDDDDKPTENDYCSFGERGEADDQRRSD